MYTYYCDKMTDVSEHNVIKIKAGVINERKLQDRKFYTREIYITNYEGGIERYNSILLFSDKKESLKIEEA